MKSATTLPFVVQELVDMAPPLEIISLGAAIEAKASDGEASVMDLIDSEISRQSK